MNLKVTLTSWWCDWFHGGGIIKRDSADRINWQCAKCGRWADPVPVDVERMVVDQDIDAAMKEPK